MMKKVVGIVCSVLLCASVASAATVNYDLKVNGSDGPVTIDNPGDTFLVEVYANVPDVDFGGGMYGGLLQSNYSLESSGGIPGLIEAVQGVGGPPSYNPTGFWDSTSYAGMTNFQGQADTSGMDVLGQTDAFPPGAASYGANWNAVGAGPGVWTLISSGDFTCLGEGETTLTLVAGPLDAQLVYHGDAPFAVIATAANGDSVEITQLPEPATIALMGLGFGATVLLRKRR